MSVRADEAIRAVALANSGVSTLISARWWPNAAPATAVYPLVVCDVENEEQVGHLSGGGWAYTDIALRIYADTYESAQAVAEKLRIALNHYKANVTVTAQTVLPTIVMQSQSDTPAGIVDGSDKPVYGITQKYRVSMAQAES